MDKVISAVDANRSFSRMLREVKTGQGYVITSRGQPVARIAPITKRSARTISARVSLLRRLRSQRPLTIGRWKRDELYE